MEWVVGVSFSIFREGKPSWRVTRRLAGRFLWASTAPRGQRTSRPPDAALPRRLWRGTRRLAGRFLLSSTAPRGQRTSRSTDVAVPRPKWRRGSFAETYLDWL